MPHAKKIIAGVFFFLSLILPGCDEALEKDLSKEQVTLLAPVNNLVSGDSSQTFAWQSLEDANAYELQIVSPRFDSIVQFVADTTVKTTFFQFSLQPGSYQWRVRAQNAGSSSLYSVSWNMLLN